MTQQPYSLTEAEYEKVVADAGKHADNRTFANAHRSDLHLIAAKKAEQAWRSRPTWPSDFCRTGA